MMRLASVLALVLICGAGLLEAREHSGVRGGAGTGLTPLDFKIEKLPNWNDTSFDMYSGYITVNAAHNRKLFFWLTESQSDPANDPLVLWMNGGPGCSSLVGLMSEQGPFRPVDKGMNLEEQMWAWNKVANVLFLESPAGVGFSFSDVKADYTVGDNRTASDVYEFLLGFTEIFTEYKNRPFWVSGESYGGHYVPAVTRKVVEGNDYARKTGGLVINLKGFLVGNAWTYSKFDNYGAAYYWWTHALVSEESFNGLVSNCNFSDIGPLVVGGGVNPAECQYYQDKLNQEMGRVFIYDVYADVCLHNYGVETSKVNPNGLPNARNDGERLMQLLGRKTGKSQAVDANLGAGPGSSDTPAGGREGYDPCEGDAVSVYMNRKDVQEAIHATQDGGGYREWYSCSPVLNYSYQDLLASMLPTYRFLMAQPDLKLLVYSGDVDGIVPVTGSRAWIKSLNLTVTTPWRSWLAPNNQTGGYITEYDGLTFTTVRNAGHQVPQYQPARALYMFTQWIHQQPFV